MSAAVVPTGVSGAVRVTQGRVVRSEWTKFRSLRSTVWTLAVAVVLMIGFAALVAAVVASQWDSFDASQRADFDPVAVSLSGLTFAQLALGVLGVLLISGEYSTGMIRSSLAAVPKRLPVLWAKLMVFSGVVFTLTLACAFVAFFLGQALLSSEDLDVGLGHSGALRSVIGSALVATVIGVICVAVGAIVRNTAAGISLFVAGFFVVPPLLDLLPGVISDRIVPYAPSNAAIGLTGGGDPGFDHALSPWVGFAVLCVYAVVFVAIAARRLVRADA